MDKSASASERRHLHRYVPPAPSHRPTTLSELAILQQRHQFIRDDTDTASSDASLSWEDKLAISWYNKLFREYALCDLSQYKIGAVALRWRTEDEVLERLGELTCGSLHCSHHKPSIDSPRENDDDTRPLVPVDLMPYQLNFAYMEQNQQKQALVKVVLCNRCKRKLTYKKDKEKKLREDQQRQRDAVCDEEQQADEGSQKVPNQRYGDARRGEETVEKLASEQRDTNNPKREGGRHRSSRSRSPRRRDKANARTHRVTDRVGDVP